MVANRTNTALDAAELQRAEAAIAGNPIFAVHSQRLTSGVAKIGSWQKVESLRLLVRPSALCSCVITRRSTITKRALLP